MAYFRLEEPVAKPAVFEVAAAGPVEKPIPNVEIQMVHPQWLIVAIVGENGIQEARRFDNPRDAIELAQNLVLLGIAKFDGKIQEVRALV